MEFQAGPTPPFSRKSMPFRSRKQRTYMRVRLPHLYAQWVAEHGKKIVPKKKKSKGKCA